MGISFAWGSSAAFVVSVGVRVAHHIAETGTAARSRRLKGQAVHGHIVIGNHNEVFNYQRGMDLRFGASLSPAEIERLLRELENDDALSVADVKRLEHRAAVELRRIELATSARRRENRPSQPPQDRSPRVPRRDRRCRSSACDVGVPQ